MLLSWLSKILAGVLAAMLAGAIIAVTFTHTVLSSHYLENQLASTHSYDKLSGALINEIKTQADGTGNPEIAAKLQSILTPVTLRYKINSALDQLQAYYRGHGPQPVIDLTDLSAQAQAAGVAIPADSGLNQPIKLAGNARMRSLSSTFDRARMAMVLVGLALVAALLIVSWERHRYVALPDVLIVVGILMGVLATMFELVSGMASHYVKFAADSNAFAAIGRNLAVAVTTDLARRFGVIAAAFIVVGVALRLWATKLRAKSLTTSSGSKLGSSTGELVARRD
jgi:hypothetical protein